MHLRAVKTMNTVQIIAYIQYKNVTVLTLCCVSRKFDGELFECRHARHARSSATEGDDLLLVVNSKR